MRAVFVVALALCVAFAAAGESDTEADVEHPVLPGLGSPCLPKRSKNRSWRVVSKRPTKFRGVCTTEAACPGAQSEPGYCAGIGVTCCKNTAAEPAAPQTWVHADEVVPKPAIILKAGAAATKCQTQGGSCGTPAACSARRGRTQSGLCPGNASNICCFAGTTAPTTPSTPAPTTPAGTNLASLIRIPAGINPGLSIAGARGLTAKIGTPGCPLTTACFSCGCAVNNAKINRNKVTLQITPNFRLTGLRPYVEAVKRAFDNLKAAGASNPIYTRVYNEAKTAGGLCCRPIKHANGTPGSTWSNHSWGCAADFYFGGNIDPRGDGKTQYGLSLLAPFMAREKLYWAAGYRGSEEDAMHFEASQEALNSWTIA